MVGATQAPVSVEVLDLVADVGLVTAMAGLVTTTAVVVVVMAVAPYFSSSILDCSFWRWNSRLMAEVVLDVVSLTVVSWTWTGALTSFSERAEPML